jgi:hypothetical protein
MEAQNGVLGWAFAHAVARLCGAGFGFATLWIFMRLWGDDAGSGPALLQLGLMLLAGLIQGALLGLVPGQVLLRLLPEADFEVFVRNTTPAIVLRLAWAALLAGLLALPTGWVLVRMHVHTPPRERQ